jgi:large subunit ribosomal protein L6
MLTFSPKKEDLFLNRSLWGTYASHVRNMVKGVTEGYTRKLILEGVGFKSEVKGQNLDLALGFSHPVIVEIPNDLTVTAEKNNITITGIDKEKVGQFAAKVRALKKPEPYKGKGFRYDDEVIRRKQGKKAS